MPRLTKFSAAITAGLVLAIAAGAQSVPSGQAVNPATERKNLTGFWQLRFDSENVPKASLLPTVTAKQVEAKQAQDEHTIRWCQYQGMPNMMASGAPIEIVQGASETAVVSETPSAVRHIYTDRTSRPDAATFDATRNGFSLGHWEGNDFLVDTSGFSGEGYVSIPGGGFRTSGSHLMERYELVENGAELEVTFTWSDPKVFAKPHTYAFRYFRVPRGYNAGEDFCDSNEQERADFLTKPPTPVK